MRLNKLEGLWGSERRGEEWMEEKKGGGFVGNSISFSTTNRRNELYTLSLRIFTSLVFIFSLYYYLNYPRIYISPFQT